MRWKKLEETSPSGKTMFKCLICERVSVTPDKSCKTFANPDGQCGEIEQRLRDHGPDTSGVVEKLRGYAEDMRLFGLSCLMPDAAAEDFDDMADRLEGKS